MNPDPGTSGYGSDYLPGHIGGCRGPWGCGHYYYPCQVMINDKLRAIQRSVFLGDHVQRVTLQIEEWRGAKGSRHATPDFRKHLQISHTPR